MAVFDYRAMGEELWRTCWKDAEDFADAWGKCQDFVGSESSHDPLRSQLYSLMLSDPILRVLLVWCAEWCGLGFPQVLVPHRLAASLMSTSVRGEAASLVRLPWPFFLVHLPGDLLEFEVNGRRVPAHYLHVSFIAAKAVLQMTSNDAPGAALYVGFDSEQDLFDGEEEGPLEEAPGAHGWKGVVGLGAVDRRALVLARRLLAGVCIEMSSPDLQREVAAGPPRPRGKGRRGSKTPTAWSFTLRRNVKVDCRDAVRSYMAGAGKPPSVQRLHRGHWQEQVHGPNNSLRKWKWHEPYWQGTEDAPIAVRAHALTAPAVAVPQREAEEVHVGNATKT